MKKENLILIIVAIILIIIGLSLNIYVYYSNKSEEVGINNSTENIEVKETNEIETIYKVEDDRINEGNVVLNDEEMKEIHKALNTKSNDNKEESKAEDLNIEKVEKISISNSNQEEIDQNQFDDKASFIMFFDYDNDDSKEMLNRINEEYNKYKESINFIIIDISENINYSLNGKYKFNIYYDIDNKSQSAYNITHTPSMIYISKEGEVINSKFGLTSVDAIQANLDILSDNF